eukprot:scaffold70726_cov62-Phaeocystis_antarctica.AAC.6
MGSAMNTTQRRRGISAASMHVRQKEPAPSAVQRCAARRQRLCVRRPTRPRTWQVLRAQEDVRGKPYRACTREPSSSRVAFRSTAAVFQPRIGVSFGHSTNQPHSVFSSEIDRCLQPAHDAHRSRQNAAASGHCAGVSIVHIPWRCPRAQPSSLALVNPHTPCCECPDAACSHLEAVSAISPGAGSTDARIVVMSSNLTLPVTSVVMCNQRHQPALFEGNQRAFGVRQRTSTAL